MRSPESNLSTAAVLPGEGSLGLAGVSGVREGCMSPLGMAAWAPPMGGC